MAYRSELMMKSLLCLIRDDKNDKFADFVGELQHELMSTANTKLILTYKWVDKLPAYCTLCNRYKMLNLLRSKLMDVHKFKGHTSFSSEIHVIGLAKALKFHECEQELREMYTNGPCDDHDTGEDLVPKDYQLYEGVLKIANTCDNVLPICDALCQLCRNGYDVQIPGSGGNTPLHAAIVHSASFDTIHQLVSLGGDMNQLDKLGISPFWLCIRKNVYRKNRNVMIKLVKLWLYQNPDIPSHLSIVKDIISCDKYFHSEQNVESDEEFYLLTLLQKGGFPIKLGDIDDVRVSSAHVVDFNIPRNLKELARMKIRCTYPGLTLHTTVKRAPLPVSVRNYILMEELNVT